MSPFGDTQPLAVCSANDRLPVVFRHLQINGGAEVGPLRTVVKRADERHSSAWIQASPSFQRLAGLRGL
jgi:hypothetical protein